MTGVAAADPNALDIGEVFAAGMAGPQKPREVPSPDDIDDEAPHGRDADGKPLAPHGYTKDGRVKKTAAGRKRNDDARIADPGSPATSPADDTGKGADRPKLEERDFSGPLAETSEAIWVGMSMLSLMPMHKIPILPKLPVPFTKDSSTGGPHRLGHYLAGLNDRVAAQAHIFNANRGALVGALNIAANNSAKARRLAEKLETGDATWALMVGAMIMPFASASASLWSGTLAEDGLPPLDQLAKANKVTMDSWIERFNTQLEEATAAAIAESEQKLAAAA